jgi:hypothetical protein
MKYYLFFVKLSSNIVISLDNLCYDNNKSSFYIGIIILVNKMNARTTSTDWCKSTIEFERRKPNSARRGNEIIFISKRLPFSLLYCLGCICKGIKFVINTRHYSYVGLTDCRLVCTINSCAFNKCCLMQSIAWSRSALNFTTLN